MCAIAFLAGLKGEAGASAPLPPSRRCVLIAVPVIMASLDVVENGCIARMLWTWPDLSHDLVHVSGLATRVKIMAGALTELLMAVLAMLWLARRGRSGSPV